MSWDLILFKENQKSFGEQSQLLFFRKTQILIFAIFELFFINLSLAQQIPVEEGQVYVCPLAKSMEEVNPRCDCRIDLILGETVTSTCPKNNQTYEMTLTITEQEGKEYYTILGFENGGAGVNLKPRAEISGKFEGIEGETLSFSASKSSDPNQDPLDFYWDFGDGNNGKGENVSHSYSSAGEYTLKLIVDDGLASSTATTQVKIYKRGTKGIVLKQEKESQVPKIEERKEEAKEKEGQQEETQSPIPPIVKGAETKEKEKKEVKKEPKKEIGIQKAETGEPFKKVFPSKEKTPSKTKILFSVLPISFLILLFLLRFFLKNVLNFKNDQKTKNSLD